jgi:hypothetical protein
MAASRSINWTRGNRANFSIHASFALDELDDAAVLKVD